MRSVRLAQLCPCSKEAWVERPFLLSLSRTDCRRERGPSLALRGGSVALAAIAMPSRPSKLSPVQSRTVQASRTGIHPQPRLDLERYIAGISIIAIAWHLIARYAFH